MELDAAFMRGSDLCSGAVAAMRQTLPAIDVAYKVATQTNHLLLAGQGADDFALAHGFTPQNLLTEKTRAQYEDWRAKVQRGEIDPDHMVGHDTIGVLGWHHLAGADTQGETVACVALTTRSWCPGHGVAGETWRLLVLVTNPGSGRRGARDRRVHSSREAQELRSVRGSPVVVVREIPSRQLTRTAMASDAPFQPSWSSVSHCAKIRCRPRAAGAMGKSIWAYPTYVPTWPVRVSRVRSLATLR